MQRFFLDMPLSAKTTLEAPRDRAHQLIRVLRVQEGERIVVFNGQGGEYEASIGSIQGHHCRIEVGAFRDTGTESPVKVTLYQGAPKKDKLELIAQKATETGVFALTPVISRFCSVHAVKRADRIAKIIEEATEQSGRVIPMKYGEAVSFEQALAESRSTELRLIAWEKEVAVDLRAVHGNYPDARSIALFIGPEGGWAEDEIVLAIEEGAVAFSLGPRIWRTETAGIVTPALVLHEWSTRTV